MLFKKIVSTKGMAFVQSELSS